MNIADEATGSHLKATAMLCQSVVAMDAQAATQVVNQCFECWGLPEQIKLDNSHPFVTPGFIDVPTRSKLWWIGLGIQVIQNDLHCPQQNGIVECLQGTLCSWANANEHDTLASLQQRLDEESDFQRNHYQIPAKGNQTRIQLYPQLEENTRTYNPSNFNIDLVYDFLAQQVWHRALTSGGTINLFGHPIYISYKMPKQLVTITFDPIEKQWMIRKEDGTLLKISKKGVPTEKQIKEFAIHSKNTDTT